MNNLNPNATQIKGMKAWVDNWKVVGPVLEGLRREDIRNTNTIRSVFALGGELNAVPFNQVLRQSSGLVEQQSWFSKYRGL